VVYDRHAAPGTWACARVYHAVHGVRGRHAAGGARPPCCRECTAIALCLQLEPAPALVRMWLLWCVLTGSLRIAQQQPWAMCRARGPLQVWLPLFGAATCRRAGLLLCANSLGPLVEACKHRSQRTRAAPHHALHAQHRRSARPLRPSAPLC